MDDELVVRAITVQEQLAEIPDNNGPFSRARLPGDVSGAEHARLRVRKTRCARGACENRSRFCALSWPKCNGIRVPHLCVPPTTMPY